MSRLFPKSLVGQMAVLIGAALLLATLAGFAFALVERQQFNRAEVDTPAITRFTSAAADFAQAAPEFKALVLTDASHRGAHYELGNATSIGPGLKRRDDTEDRLQQSLTDAGVRVLDVRAASVPANPERQSDVHRRHGASLLLSAELPDKRWINARMFVPTAPPLITPELWVAALLVYLFVLAAAVLIAVRMARPLRDLTQAAEAFRGRNEPVTVEPRGPADLREAIDAFNAMNRRVVDLLEEKDRTLGAIGHDLRTPLASLRIRAESVEPEEERDRMIATIEEMTATLEDILTLARVGRSREKFEAVDISALMAAIAADYRELGKEVPVASDGAHVVQVQPNLLRRAIRNLLDNALNYGGTAEVDLRGVPGAVTIAVLDNGPGLSADDLKRVRGAFYRGEPSRNRETGGAGLGLSIAQAVADAHDGTLTLANREGGGLAAAITIPLRA
ncbi:MAG TPA: ATP-binding protein [Sphingomicrobium sp.]|nr:ATP-binding protein [Sphingomicrobium sp.]